MSPLELAAICAVVLVGAMLQGAVGFGYALVSAPLLLLVDARLVPGPLIGAAFLLVTLTALRDRGSIDFSGLGWTLLGRLPATALGALAVGAIPASEMGAPVGALVLVAVFMTAIGWHVQPEPWTLVAAGAASGFMGTASSIGGPPLAIVYQHSSGPQLRGTLGALFTIGCVISLFGLWLVGRFGGTEVALTGLLLPGTALGFALSGRLTPLVDRGYTRPAVLGVSGLAGVLVLIRALL